MKKTRTLPLRRVFLIPLALFLISFTGLVWALLVDGLPDVFAGIAVAVSVIVPGWFVLRRR
ncbi:conserved hypothetical protein [Hyphomonas neptunium ATCC 15444]|uniref:Uncharacterized protein n=2 Tax=Hyphomonas TaxID=85 RepID=Q0C074_HYPNA|nr:MULTISPECIES: hypothetical protein [Hyphomonas]ABI78768.1 conserved hypothetical protein [Hyphomonas neptunium ATCC 15444]KCZ90550.1 hypothetical protein HHI_13465 [Hyphomonas hirschiana VP5]